MKSTIIILTAACFAISAIAQNQPADTVTDHQLGEVVIQAPKVIRKADMDVYHPSESAIEHSQNGMQLLTNLMIPTLSVSDALGTVQAAGQAVQLRINGRVSSVQQVRALLPETIRRVEYIDNPGLRYGGATCVLNFIVSNPTVGGSLMAMARPAVNQAWGFYMADAKFNTGRSQWSVGGNFKLTNRTKTHRDYNETFTYPDGSSITRDETSRGGYINNSMANTWASYNYIKPDTTVFMAEVSMYHNISDRFLYHGLLSLSNGSDDILLTDSNGSCGYTPSLSLYWQQSLPHNQMIVADFSSSFYSGRSFSDYMEQFFI